MLWACLKKVRWRLVLLGDELWECNKDSGGRMPKVEIGDIKPFNFVAVRSMTHRNSNRPNLVWAALVQCSASSPPRLVITITR